MQGLEFSFDVVVGGEVKSSRIFNKDESSLDLYLGDKRSTNRVPWCFCVPHRLSLIHIYSSPKRRTYSKINGLSDPSGEVSMQKDRLVTREKL